MNLFILYKTKFTVHMYYISIISYIVVYVSFGLCIIMLIFIKIYDLFIILGL